MAAPNIQQTREKLRSLAAELMELSSTYTPPPPGVWSSEDPFISKAKHLLLTTQTPIEHVSNLCSTTLETIPIKTLLSLHAIQSIPPSGSISLSSLSTATGASEQLLSRLLRILITSNFLIQDPQGNFSHSVQSAGYLHPGTQHLLNICYEEGLTKLINLPSYLELQRHATGKLEEPGFTRDSTLFNLATWSAGQEGKKTTFEIMQEDPIKMQKFQKNLTVTAHLNPYVGYYDFSKLATDDPDRAVFVDVGGGHGHAIQHVLSANPTIQPSQCILQDAVPVVEFAETSNHDLPKGVKFQAHDFFSPQPVKGAKAYYFRAIAHDLSDANMVRVLKNVIPAMGKDSKILIADNIIPETGGTNRTGMMDMMMMVIGGKERTEKNLREVVEAAGLKVEGVHYASGKGTYGIVEAALV